MQAHLWREGSTGSSAVHFTGSTGKKSLLMQPAHCHPRAEIIRTGLEYSPSLLLCDLKFVCFNPLEETCAAEGNGPGHTAAARAGPSSWGPINILKCTNAIASSCFTSPSGMKGIELQILVFFSGSLCGYSVCFSSSCPGHPSPSWTQPGQPECCVSPEHWP